MKVIFPFRATVIFGALFAVVIGFVVVDLTAQYARYYPFDFPLRWRVDRLFHLGREANIPCWYSTILLMVAALLLAVIAFVERLREQKGVLSWLFLSLIFVYLSADEAAMLHEEIGSLLAQQFPASVFRHGWFVFGAMVLSIFAVIYLRFFLELPRETQVLFFAAGLLFVGAALGVEILASPYENGRAGDFGFALLVAFEESLEMSGVIVFIYGLYRYMISHFTGLSLLVDLESSGRNQEIDGKP